MDGDHRHVEPERLPMISIVERNVNALFCSGKQQPFAPRVFTNHANEIHVANTANRFLAGLTEVARSEDMRAQIIEIVSIDGRISGARVEMRSFQNAHPASLRHAWRSQVLPRLARIFRNLDVPI